MTPDAFDRLLGRWRGVARGDAPEHLTPLARARQLIAGLAGMTTEDTVQRLRTQHRLADELKLTIVAGHWTNFAGNQRRALDALYDGDELVGFFELSDGRWRLLRPDMP